MSDRRSFLRGLVTLPLIGGGVTLIGQPSAPVPLVQAAAMRTLDDPRQRARYAWQAFSSAMGDLTASADGWRILGAGVVRGCGYVEPSSFLRTVAVHYVRDTEPRCQGLIVERREELAL